MLLALVSAARRVAPTQHQHGSSEEEEGDAPFEVDVDAERAVVDFWVAEESVCREDHAEQAEHEANRQANVEIHFRPFSARARPADNRKPTGKSYSARNPGPAQARQDIRDAG